MFWRFEMRTASHIDALLEKEDVPLGEILDEDDVLQECKAQNKKLIDFLSKEKVVEDLVDLITNEPPTDIEDSIQYKHPNMACELLTADIGAITDKLADEENIFNKLWKFLDKKPPLNPLLASFFSKTVGSLLARRPELVIEYIKKQEDCLGIFFKHLETSAIMDLILRLITCIDSQELRTPFLEWLNDQKFIQRLVDLIDPEQSEEIHSNAAQSLCDIIRLTREHMSQLQECAENDPLLTTIEKQETVSELLEHMFRGKRVESALVNGVTVLLSLLEFKKQSDTFLFPSPEGQEQMTALDAERLAKGVSGTLKAIVPKLSELNTLLQEPPRIESMVTTVGKLEPPFGFVRLQVCKLISSLLVTNSPAINSELAKLGTIKTLWDLFFKYMWNNFLHLEVEKSIATILTNSAAETEEDGKLQHPLLVHLFTECKLVQKIIDMWEENDSSQQQGGKRYGYMGHLTRIANCLTNEVEKGCNSEQIKSLMEEYVPQEYRDRWAKFVTGGLAEMNKRNIVDMVGTNAFHSSSDDEDPDFRDIDFGKDTALQQAFSDYQMQQMTSHFIDQFGFAEDEFTEQDQGVNNPFDRISDINFSISANEDNPNSALFEACCNEKISSFQYNNSDDEDMWEEKEFSYPGETKQRDRSGALKDENDSSDSDEALGDDDFPPVHRPKPLPPQEDIRMDVDQGDAWVANFDGIPMDSSVPMDSAPTAWQLPPQTQTSGGENGGWANFDEFNPGFQAQRSEENMMPRSSSPVEMESTPSSQRVSSETSASAGDSSDVSEQQVPPLLKDSSNSEPTNSQPEGQIQDQVDGDTMSESTKKNSSSDTKSQLESETDQGNQCSDTSGDKEGQTGQESQPVKSSHEPQSMHVEENSGEIPEEKRRGGRKESVEKETCKADSSTVKAECEGAGGEEETTISKEQCIVKGGNTDGQIHSLTSTIRLEGEQIIQQQISLDSPLTVKPNGPVFDKQKHEEKTAQDDSGGQDDQVTTESTQNGPV